MNNTVLTRPSSGNYNVPDGTYQAEIVSAVVEEKPNRFQSGQFRQVLLVTVAVVGDSGPVSLRLYLNVSWQEDKPLYRFLSDFDCLPDGGEDLDLSILIGRTVTIVVQNVEKDGRTYSNILSIKPRKSAPQKGNSPSSKTIQIRPVKLREEDLDSIFEDDDD